MITQIYSLEAKCQLGAALEKEWKARMQRVWYRL